MIMIAFAKLSSRSSYSVADMAFQFISNLPDFTIYLVDISTLAVVELEPCESQLVSVVFSKLWQ